VLRDYLNHRLDDLFVYTRNSDFLPTYVYNMNAGSILHVDRISRENLVSLFGAPLDPDSTSELPYYNFVEAPMGYDGPSIKLRLCDGPFVNTGWLGFDPRAFTYTYASDRRRFGSWLERRREVEEGRAAEARRDASDWVNFEEA
jgi:hypothetical protein